MLLFVNKYYLPTVPTDNILLFYRKSLRNVKNDSMISPKSRSG